MSQQQDWPLRYVVLHHTGIDKPHFDLMFETSVDSPLATWRCDDWPVRQAQRAIRVGEHRRVYLDYEGDLSNARGRVTRVAAGKCAVRSMPNQFLLRLEDGAKLALRKVDADCADAWEISPLSA